MDAMASRNLAAVILYRSPPFTACPHEDKFNLGAFGDEFTFELSQAAKMPKTSLPAGLVVSIEAPCPDNRPTGNSHLINTCGGVAEVIADG
jgi:hypothetical protein